MLSVSPPWVKMCAQIHCVVSVEHDRVHVTRPSEFVLASIACEELMTDAYYDL